MIHPDVAVAVCSEVANGIKHDVHLFRRSRKIRGKNAPLGLEVIRQMRVVIKRNAIRAQFDHLINRLFKGCPRLLRQSVNQVHIDGMETVFTRFFHHGLHHVKRLNAVHGLLHVRIEVLHAETHAVKTRLFKGLHLVLGTGPRIDFDRKLTVRREGEPLLKAFHQVKDFLVGEEGRRTAAPVQLLQSLRTRNEPLHQIGFLQKQIDVFLGARMVTGHDLVAAAVKADVVTERDVRIERKPRRFR